MPVKSRQQASQGINKTLTEVDERRDTGCGSCQKISRRPDGDLRLSGCIDEPRRICIAVNIVSSSARRLFHGAGNLAHSTKGDIAATGGHDSKTDEQHLRGQK